MDPNALNIFDLSYSSVTRHHIISECIMIIIMSLHLFNFDLVLGNAGAARKSQ